MYNDALLRRRYRSKVWLIKTKKQGLKNPTFQIQNGFSNCY
jgi:hypothetical protein